MSGSSPLEEGETPCAIGATPAGGINTATNAVLCPSQHNNNSKQNEGDPSISDLSAVNPSSTEQISPLKARKLPIHSSSKNKDKSNNKRSALRNPYRHGYKPKNENKSSATALKTNTTGAKRQTSDDNNTENSSPNPLQKKKGPNNRRKKKESVTRTIHEFRPNETLNNNNITSLNDNNTSAADDTASSTASSNSVAKTTKSTSTSTKNKTKKVVLKSQISFEDAAKSANAKLVTKGENPNEKNYQPSTPLLESLRPHVFRDDLVVPLAKEDRLKFQNEFNEAKSYNFDKRQLSQSDKESKRQFHQVFNHHGFGSNGIILMPRKGDVSQLSRYLVEDLILCNEHEPLVIAVRKGKGLWNNCYANVLNVQKNQPHGLGGATRHFQTQHEYIMLSGRMIINNVHTSIKSGNMTLSAIQSKFYDGSGSFQFIFDGTNTIATFSWRDLINDPMEVMFFGAPTVTNRFFNQLFHHRNCIQYCFRVYRQLASEVWGDALASNKLSDAYKDALINILENETTKLTKAVANPGKDVSFLGEEKTDFFHRVDALFYNKMYEIHRQMNIYTNMVVDKSRLEPLIEESKKLFPDLWSILRATRGVNPTIARSKHLVEGKEWQIFFMILQQARMADRRRLTAWAFVQTYSNYSRGVSQKACCNSYFWGSTLSPSTMERMLDEFTSHVIEDQSKMLSNMTSVTFCIDNCQKGQELTFQNGGSSSNMTVGTSLLAIQAHEFNDTQYDDLNVEIHYDNRLGIPSMPGQPAYEIGFDFSPENLHNSLLGHTNMAKVDKPCVTGARVDALMKAVNICHWIEHSYRVFITKIVSPPNSGFNDAKLAKVIGCFRSRGGRDLVKCAKNFQVESVKFYKSAWGAPTPQNYLGIAAIREDAARGVGILAIDLLLRCGVFESPSPGEYTLGKDWKSKRPIFVGDRKTAENITAWIRSAENRGLSFSQTSAMTEIFLDGLSRLMVIPGDWHAGMAMLQSIFTLFWDGIIEPFVHFLGWSRITISVKDNYFNCKRIVEFVSDEIIRMLKYEFMSEYAEFDEDRDDSAQFICASELKFLQFLLDLTEAEDEWRRACALFVLMVADFSMFVNSYRRECPLGIEWVYKKWMPIFHQLGQSKYFAGCLDQIDVLYSGEFPLSRLFELRLNRTGRRYDAKYGKRACAIDEIIEIFHKVLAGYPMPKSIDGLVRMGTSLGLGEMCQRFSDGYYNINGVKEQVEVNVQAIEPSVIPEMKRIFEVLLLLKTSTEQPDRKLTLGLVRGVEDKITTSLERTAKKQSLKKAVNSNYSYNSVERSVDLIEAANNVGRAQANNNNIDEMEIDDDESVENDNDGNGSGNCLDELEEVALTEEELALADESADSIVIKKGKKGRKKGKKKQRRAAIHPLALVNNWKEGDAAIIAKDIKRVRDNEKERLKRKRRVAKQMFKTQQNNQQQDTPVGKEIPEIAMPSWRLRTIRKRQQAEFQTEVLNFNIDE